jgi:hypothetical protein
MKKLASTDEFYSLKQRLLLNQDLEKPTVVISAGTCGQASGANELIRVAKREILNNNLSHKISLRINTGAARGKFLSQGQSGGYGRDN